MNTSTCSKRKDHYWYDLLLEKTTLISYLQVNTLSEWVIRIYLHSFTNNENFEFNVSEWVQVNPNNSQTMSVLTFLSFKLNTLQKNRHTLSWPKPWCNESSVLNLHHGYYTMIMTSRRLFCHNPVSHGTNQPIRKSEFLQCMKVE